MSDLSNYLAQHYLVADPKPTKKSKKKKNKDASSGLLIADDDDNSWGQPTSNTNKDDEEMSGAVAGTSAEFRKTKKSNWKSLSGTKSAEDAAADAILASAVAERQTAQEQDDEMPMVDASTSDPSAVLMADGTHAGLQSAAAVSAQLKKRQREERAEFEKSHKGGEAETVYRDATGRRIDISMRREAARKAEKEKEEKELEAKKALKGEVQLELAKRRREELEDAAFMTVARHADDLDLNQELKEQQRWNDPMAQFLTPKPVTEMSGKKGSKSRRPVYPRAAPPNRYGIKPGYRWDGVDRGNGFEAERFKALNKKERHKDLEYSWQMDE